MPDLNQTNSMTVQRELLRRSTLLPAALASEHARTCPYCGGEILPTIGEFAHPTRPNVVSRPLIWPDRHGCPEETRALALQAQQTAQERADAERQAWASALCQAGLIGDLARRSLANFQARPDWSDALHVLGRVRGFSYALLNGTLDKPWLILHGSYGTGKSHLAAALVRAALEAGWTDVYFRVWPEYLQRLKASWGRNRDGSQGEIESDIETELQRGRLVVIDDLDKRRPTDWAKETLFGVINYRYNANLPTVLTFNYAPDDVAPNAPGQLALVEYLGEAVVDRLIEEAFDTIAFDGPSYRSKVEWRKAA